MPTNRERRLTLNEAAFRVANERMRNWPERRSNEAPARYYCECAHATCHEHVVLSGTEYERVRADSHHFVVVPGHEMPDVEKVVFRTARYAVVEKDVEMHALSEITDPRRDG
ncbi:MAG TPA: hypothetical protein VN213_20940 [Solirubrobacteraceae bacterium]|nr:hypothetical protein [Solirubrobacteraceae bacterium]